MCGAGGVRLGTGTYEPVRVERRELSKKNWGSPPGGPNSVALTTGGSIMANLKKKLREKETTEKAEGKGDQGMDLSKARGFREKIDSGKKESLPSTVRQKRKERPSCPGGTEKTGSPRRTMEI